MILIRRISAFLFALLVPWVGNATSPTGVSLRCQSVFASFQHQSVHSPSRQRMSELTDLLRVAGFHEFKNANEGLGILNRTARQNPAGLLYYVKALKALEKTLSPNNPQEVVRALEQLLTPTARDCRGGDCTVTIRSNHSCVAGNCNSRLIEETSITGERKLLLQYQEIISLFGQDLRIWLSEPVSMDNLTGALTPKGMGIRALNDIVQAAQSRVTPSAVVFIDVNDLSKVNYFRNAFYDGDAYIKAVGRVLKSSLRSGDTFVRMGGDEFVLILDPMSPEAVRELSGRLIHAVANDPEALSVFQNQWGFLEDKISEIENARDLKGIGQEAEPLIWAQKEVLKRMARERNRVPHTFKEFQADAIEVLKDWVQKQKVLLAPNVSVGSTFIRQGDTLDSVIYRASCNANLCKRTHKEALGADARKYGGAPENERLILQNAQSGARPLPQALLPDHVKVDAVSESTQANANERPPLTLEGIYD